MNALLLNVIISFIELLAKAVFNSEEWGKLQASVHIAEQSNASGLEKFGMAYAAFQNFAATFPRQLANLVIHTGIQLAVLKMSAAAGKSLIVKQ